MGEAKLMLIIGERINTSRNGINEAVKRRDSSFIVNESRKQIEHGASIVDVNCGLSMEKELEDMLWLIDTIQAGQEVPLSIDTPNGRVLKEALSVHKGRAMVNSITAEKARYEQILPIIKDSDCQIIALTMDEKGVPKTAQERFEIATIIMEICQGYGIKRDRLYFDVLIRPLSAEQPQALEALKAIRMIKEIGLKTIAGLSNISFGLPNRSLINRTFLTMACEAGLDACIADPLDTGLISSIITTDVIINADEYAMKYINAFRAGRLVK